MVLKILEFTSSPVFRLVSASAALQLALSSPGAVAQEPTAVSAAVPFLTTREIETSRGDEPEYSTDVGPLSAGLCELELNEGDPIRIENRGVSAGSVDETLDGFVDHTIKHPI